MFLNKNVRWTAMMWAALAGHLGVCKWLKDQAKMECGYLTDSHEHALHKAAANGHWDVQKRSNQKPKHFF